jgi:hypothetical protein
MGGVMGHNMNDNTLPGSPPVGRELHKKKFIRSFRVMPHSFMGTFQIG